MASLKSVCELAYRQVNPNNSTEFSIDLEEFIATGYNEYALQMFIKARNEKREDGTFDIPSSILVEREITVDKNEADISGFGIMRSMPEEKWLQKIGEVGCECKYVKSDINKTSLLCDDDSLDDNARTYYVVGNRIKFPQGTHSNKIPFTYASNGEGIDGDVDIDEAIAGIIRTRLLDIYLGKIAPEDLTNNSNSSK